MNANPARTLSGPADAAAPLRGGLAGTAQDWVLVLGGAGEDQSLRRGESGPQIAADSARYALAAVEFYADAAGDSDSPLGASVVSLLSDLMHLADYAGLDFAAALSAGADGYEADLDDAEWPGVSPNG